MLLEMWAYVADVLGFYDERTANEAYLRTASLASSLRALVRHVGYAPRPGVAAEVNLAVFAAGHSPIGISRGLAVRSEAFGSEPPQVFETAEERSFHELANEWTIGPQRNTKAEDAVVAAGTPATLLFNAAGLGLKRSGLAYFFVEDGGTAVLVRAATRVLDVVATTAIDGRTYGKVIVAEGPTFGSSVSLDSVQVTTPSLSAVTKRLPLLDVGDPAASTGVSVDGTRIVLDAVYRQITKGSRLIVARGTQLVATEAAAVEEVSLKVGGTDSAPVVAPATAINLVVAVPSNFHEVVTELTIHFNMVDAGTLTSVAKTQLAPSDLGNVTLQGVLESPPFPDQLKEFLLQDKDENGAEVTGSVAFTDAGTGTFSVDSASQNALAGVTFKNPLRVFGNVLRATRGETVRNEVLGSGDASTPFQTFRLKKKPLTYVSAPTLGDERGIQSTLQLSVNGVLWKEVRSFFGQGPTDEVFIVRHGDDQSTTITFGDGVHGRRVPSGIDNVTATYRFGSGAAAPPANTIKQLAKPVKGLSRVFNAVQARGGADPESPKQLRTSVPRSVLTLGRAVSIQDFAALVENSPGVRNSRTIWAFDEDLGRPVVKSWVFGDVDPAKIRRFLRQQSDPSVTVEVFPARAVAAAFFMEVQRDPRFDKETVERNVADVLFGEEGILTPDNIPIGAPIYRSRISEAVLAVEGVVGIDAFTLFAASRDPRTVSAATAGAFLVDEGQYLSFQPPGSFCTVIQSVEATGLLEARA